MHCLNLFRHHAEKKGDVCNYKVWFQLQKSINDILYCVKFFLSQRLSVRYYAF